jgi:hypothetical protein
MAETKKVTIPDGNGGWKEIEGEVHAGSAIDQKKQQEALAAQFYSDAGGLTERLHKFSQLHCTENGLTKEHLVFAAALFTINLRESYPEGKEAFDTLSESAWDYYEKNKPKR